VDFFSSDYKITKGVNGRVGIKLTNLCVILTISPSNESQWVKNIYKSVKNGGAQIKLLPHL